MLVHHGHRRLTMSTMQRSVRASNVVGSLRRSCCSSTALQICGHRCAGMQTARTSLRRSNTNWRSLSAPRPVRGITLCRVQPLGAAMRTRFSGLTTRPWPAGWRPYATSIRPANGSRPLSPPWSRRQQQRNERRRSATQRASRVATAAGRGAVRKRARASDG